jgi:hypothetical protein
VQGDPLIPVGGQGPGRRGVPYPPAWAARLTRREAEVARLAGRWRTKRPSHPRPPSQDRGIPIKVILLPVSAVPWLHPKKARLNGVRGKGRTTRTVFLGRDARHAIADYVQSEGSS